MIRLIAILAASITLPAANYTVQKTSIDSIEVYILRDAARAAEVRVAPALGMNSYEMTVKGKRVFWSPYKGPGELAAKPTLLGNPLLWPWANRIDGTSFWANGRKYAFDMELGNVRPGPNTTPIHGLLLFEKRWVVTSAKADRKGAAVTARLEYSKYPELAAQFPFAHSIEITYRLAEGVLDVKTTVQNLSSEAMPLSLGFHPYFQVNDAPRDEWNVRIPAKRKCKLSSKLIPTGELLANPYPESLGLKDVFLDDVFVDLVRDPDGRAKFSVTGKSEKVTVEFGPKFTVGVVYAPKGRAFICFEPMTAVTNAFNAAHDGWYKELQSIPPGGVWQESYLVRATGF